MSKFIKTNFIMISAMFMLVSCAYSQNKNTVTDQTKNANPIIVELQQSFRDIAANDTPSVVSIGTEKSVTQQYIDPFDFFFGNPFDDNNPKNYTPKQRQYKQTALGSGVIYRKKGNTYYIVTNNHVIDGADKIKVTIGENKSYDAKLLGADPDVDIAVVKIDTSDNLKLANFGDSGKLQVGDLVIAIGNPFGLSGTMTFGIISALGRSNINTDQPSLTDFIQTDAAINPGNSGGSLSNINGEVIGINTMIYSQSGGNIGIGFAIPINVAKKVADEIIDKGKSKIEHGYLGIYFEEINDQNSKTLGLKNVTNGMFVNRVFAGGPADKAGIKAGDIILEVNGKQAKKSSDFSMLIGNSAPGTKLNFKIYRDGQTFNKDVTLGNRSQMATAEQNTNQSVLDNYGLAVADLNNDLRNKYRIPSNVNGVLITDVDRQGAASSAGLQPGDVIFRINSQKITKTDELIKILNDNKDNQNYFYIIRNGQEFVTVM